MKAVQKKWAGVFSTAAAGLDVGEHRRLIDPAGSFMDLSVERLGHNLFSFSHYGLQNGDLMADPDMEFFRPEPGTSPNVWLPITYRNDYMRKFDRAVVDWQNGEPLRYHRRLQASLAKFANTWAENIQFQQSDALALLKSGNCWKGRAQPGRKLWDLA